MIGQTEKQVGEVVKEDSARDVADAVRLKPWQKVFIEVREPVRIGIRLQLQLSVEADVCDLIANGHLK